MHLNALDTCNNVKDQYSHLVIRERILVFTKMLGALHLMLVAVYTCLISPIEFAQ